MKSISKEITSEIIIKKSKFITILYPVDSVDSIKLILEDIKKKYKGATHYCYAYKIGATEKCSDDGEPSKTAGLPMLNVIKNEDLDYILCIVIRYFGGIKLGASGLIHAYQDSVKTAVLQSDRIELTEGLSIQITFPYDKVKTVDYLLKDVSMIQKDFNEMVGYLFEIEKNKWDLLQKNLDFVTINFVKEKLIQKK